MSWALVLDDVDLTEYGAQGTVDDGVRSFFDDDRVDSERFGVEGVLELETEDIAVGEEGKLDTITEGGVPGDKTVGGCIFGHDGPPYVYSGVAVHGAWVFGKKVKKIGATKYGATIFGATIFGATHLCVMAPLGNGRNASASLLFSPPDLY
jgi:hypothetical protein